MIKRLTKAVSQHVIFVGIPHTQGKSIDIGLLRTIVVHFEPHSRTEFHAAAHCLVSVLTNRSVVKSLFHSVSG